MLDSVFAVPPVFDDSYCNWSNSWDPGDADYEHMGNYAHGNRPIRHMIYMYNYAGEPWKTQYWLREVMNRMYTCNPDGYCVDEDNGQTSARYVFSALGFYPVCAVRTNMWWGLHCLKALLLLKMEIKWWLMLLKTIWRLNFIESVIRTLKLYKIFKTCFSFNWEK